MNLRDKIKSAKTIMETVAVIIFKKVNRSEYSVFYLFMKGGTE